MTEMPTESIERKYRATTAVMKRSVVDKRSGSTAYFPHKPKKLTTFVGLFNANKCSWNGTKYSSFTQGSLYGIYSI